MYGICSGSFRRGHGQSHAVPDDDCTCGIRGLTNLGELLAYRGAKGIRGWSDACHVIGQVELFGRTSGPACDDPPSTLRAAEAEVAGYLFVPRPLWSGAELLEQNYPRVRVRRVETLAPERPEVLAAELGAAELARLHAALFG